MVKIEFKRKQAGNLLTIKTALFSQKSAILKFPKSFKEGY